MSVSQFNTYQQLTSCRLVSTSPIVGTYTNGPSNSGVGALFTVTATGQLTIDSILVNVGDRVLLQAQTAALQNGVYIVNNNGLGGANPVLQRSADFQNIEQMKVGQFIPVGAGTAHAGSMFVLTEPLPAAVGVSPILFVLTPVSAPGGTLLAVNNLSDVASVATSRTNLGLGTAAVLAASNAGQPTLSSVVGSPTTNQVAIFNDALGSIQASGYLSSAVQLNTNIRAGVPLNVSATPSTTSLAITVAGLTTSSIVVANVLSSSAGVYLVETTVGTGSFTVTVSDDPGVSLIIDYVAFIAAQ